MNTADTTKGLRGLVWQRNDGLFDVFTIESGCELESDSMRRKGKCVRSEYPEHPPIAVGLRMCTAKRLLFACGVPFGKIRFRFLSRADRNSGNGSCLIESGSIPGDKQSKRNRIDKFVAAFGDNGLYVHNLTATRERVVGLIEHLSHQPSTKALEKFVGEHTKAMDDFYELVGRCVSAARDVLVELNDAFREYESAVSAINEEDRE